MKQPIITRDIERKAIYTNIMYDPEWLTIEAVVNEEDSMLELYISNCTYNYVVDWGDGIIEKNSDAHNYKKCGTYIVRIKGSIIYKGDPADRCGLFDSDFYFKAILYGSKFDTNLHLFSSS